MTTEPSSELEQSGLESTDSLFEVRNLRKWYRDHDGGVLSTLFGDDRHIKAVDDVSLDIYEGEILGLAGQSGCGKSTLGDLLVGLQQPTDGDIRFRGEAITDYTSEERKAFRRECQVIFQNPYEALNPRFPVARTVAEPLKIHGIGSREEREARMIQALEDTGLRPPGKFVDQLPGDLSGGERQRVCIARALVLDPSFLVADEPVSMLDVSVRTGILHLFKRLQRERGMSILYISHDLSTINYLADRTQIMYLGNIVEVGPTEQVIHEPAHPYTEALLQSVPDPNPDRTREKGSLGGDVPDPVDLPQGCRFHPRCRYATEDCVQTEPELIEHNTQGTDQPAHQVACYHPVDE
jgi:peptide/nickel transport system ATP-binding protein